MNIDSLIEQEFPLTDEWHYLNHAGVGPWPRRTSEAIQAFAEENLQQGAAEYPRWNKLEAQLRQQLAEFINAPSSADIALLKNTSEGLSMVAHGFPWSQGDNVVISDQEFPSNRVVWESLSTYGVETRQVPIDISDPEQALMNACDSHTKMLSISNVQYASGLRMDLVRIGEFCKQKNIAFCVDAIQGLGVFAHDVQAMHIDFLCADAHKWLLGPEGIAVFYCDAKWRDRLALHEFGWHMVENPHDFNQVQWIPAKNGQRFECGSPNMLGVHGFAASLSLFNEVGMDIIESRILERTEFFFEQLGNKHDLECLTDPKQGRYAGIVVIRNKNKSAADLFPELMKQKIVCAERGGGIRFSPHFYTPLSALSFAIEAMAK